MSIADMISALDVRMDGLSQEIDALQRERQAHLNAAVDLERRLDKNRRELAGYLLPDLDDEDLAALERRLRYPGLLPIKRKFELRLAAIEEERRRIEDNPDYAEREVRLVDVETQLAELEEPARSFRQDREPWESSPHFQALLARGWFEEGYDPGLFDWLRDWRACSLLMADLEQKTGQPFPDDDDIKARWRALAAASDPVFQLIAQLEAQREHVRSLEARHAELVAAPDALHQELWAALAQAVSDHLESCPDDVLVELGQHDPMLATFLKKGAGLKKQASYLHEIATTRVDGLIKSFEAELRKAKVKRDKLSYKRARGKFVAINPLDVKATRTLPLAKWSKRRDSLTRTRTRIVEFDAWDRGAYTSDFLWWDLVAKNDPGNDLRVVQIFRAAHPDWSLTTFVDPLDQRTPAAERAAASMDLAAPQTVEQMADQLAGATGDFFDAS